MVTIDSRAAKWLALALLVSLALNLFLGGLLAGRYFGPQHRTFARSEAYERPGQEFFRRLIGRVPAEHRGGFDARSGHALPPLRNRLFEVKHG